MTIEDGIDLVDTLLRLRREVAGLARSVDVRSPTFVVEWSATIAEIQARLVALAHAEEQLEPILRPPGGEPFSLEQYRSWLTRMAQRDEDGQPLPAAGPPRLLHPSSVH